MSLAVAAVALAALLAASSAAAAPLLLTPLIQKGETAQARKLSAVQLAGKSLGNSAFLTVPSASGKNSNNIYFWFQPCPNCTGMKPEDVPFILWLQGGPGGPGTFGALSEIGNWYLDSKGNLHERCYSWCQTANCLFVDQPVQTGFSYQLNSQGKFDPKNIEYTATSKDAMKQVWELLQQFYQVWPEYVPSPFYITGESYGGLYTSWMGYTVFEQNKALAAGQDVSVSSLATDGFKAPRATKIKLTGLAVGDPIINSEYQWPTYPHTLYGMGVIMLEERKQLEGIFASGISHLGKEGQCWDAFTYWNSVWNDNGGGGAPGLYYEMTGSSMTEDVLLGREPAEFGYSTAWFNRSDVAEAFHIAGSPSHSFAEGGEVYNTMVRSGDFCSNSSWILATLLLEAKIDVMVYSSTVDPLLGPPTTEAGITAIFDYAATALIRDGGPAAQSRFWSQKKTIWRADENDANPSGFARCVTLEQDAGQRFCYTVLKNGGHEAPAFIPREAYDMFDRFRYRRAFDKTGQNPNAPKCNPCGGVPPFAGPALPECVCGA